MIEAPQTRSECAQNFKPHPQGYCYATNSARELLLKARAMPLKQKKQKLDGQQTIRFGPSVLQLEKLSTVADIAKEAAVITADGSAFTDTLRCMYFLMKQEIAHTTNFAELQFLCCTGQYYTTIAKKSKESQLSVQTDNQRNGCHNWFRTKGRYSSGGSTVMVFFHQL